MTKSIWGVIVEKKYIDDRLWLAIYLKRPFPNPKTGRWTIGINENIINYARINGAEKLYIPASEHIIKDQIIDMPNEIMLKSMRKEKEFDWLYSVINKGEKIRRYFFDYDNK